jgi:hypothetical protein
LGELNTICARMRSSKKQHSVSRYFYGPMLGR